MKQATTEMVTFPAKYIHVSINRPADAVYEFASNPENLPAWASGLSSAVRKEGEDWLTDSPMGTVKVRFAVKNTFGILDHDVTLPTGVTVHNPMRVFPNNKGSEVVFTVYQLPGVSEEQYAEDAKAVTQDLNRLKNILEE